jgi:predicted amidophosphoribosyltransferase
MRDRLCSWHCGRKTKNVSGICDPCWADRDAIRLARKARELAEELHPNRQAALSRATAARRAKRHDQSHGTELLA